MRGLIHIYTGDGKGKTTAAIGLSIRCAGSGGEVLFSQFLKNNQSSELNVLKQIPNIQVVSTERTFGFISGLSENLKIEAKIEYSNYLYHVLELVKAKGPTMLILDEIIGAYNHNVIERHILTDFLMNKADYLEVVMTGRNPALELLELADYVSDIKKVKHPYDQGINARVGIEK